ncbi:hypothetical protein DFH29DRAFT_880752 [Suillus ampliporus]|nr:hypothetical protein DFH29DRAFT_880752 [Suillus ampliporus]
MSVTAGVCCFFRRARHLDYSRLWIMNFWICSRETFLEKFHLDPQDGVETMYGADALQSPMQGTDCKPRRWELGKRSSKSLLRRCSLNPAAGTMAFYMSGTAQTFDRASRHAVAVSTTQHLSLKEDDNHTLAEGIYDVGPSWRTSLLEGSKYSLAYHDVSEHFGALREALS